MEYILLVVIKSLMICLIPRLLIIVYLGTGYKYLLLVPSGGY